MFIDKLVLFKWDDPNIGIPIVCIESAILLKEIRDFFPEFSGTIPVSATHMKGDDLSCLRYPLGELHLDEFPAADYFLNFVFQLAGSRSVIC